MRVGRSPVSDVRNNTNKITCPQTLAGQDASDRLRIRVHGARYSRRRVDTLHVRLECSGNKVFGRATIVIAGLDETLKMITSQ
jgi:hypothetical protein